MPVFAALLRGVNVSGKRPVPMAKLAQLGTDLGYVNVRTYLQSGNVIFAAHDRKDAERFPAAIRENFHADIETRILSATELRAIARANPFPDVAEDKFLVCVFVFEPRKNLEGPLPLSGSERVKLVKGNIYVHYGDGQGRSKLTLDLFERRLKSICTARNWLTVRALIDLCTEAAKATNTRR